MAVVDAEQVVGFVVAVGLFGAVGHGLLREPPGGEDSYRLPPA